MLSKNYSVGFIEGDAVITRYKLGCASFDIDNKILYLFCNNLMSEKIKIEFLDTVIQIRNESTPLLSDLHTNVNDFSDDFDPKFKYIEYEISESHILPEVISSLKNTQKIIFIHYEEDLLINHIDSLEKVINKDMPWDLLINSGLVSFFELLIEDLTNPLDKYKSEELIQAVSEKYSFIDGYTVVNL